MWITLFRLLRSSVRLIPLGTYRSLLSAVTSGITGVRKFPHCRLLRISLTCKWNWHEWSTKNRSRRHNFSDLVVMIKSKKTITGAEVSIQKFHYQEVFFRLPMTTQEHRRRPEVEWIFVFQTINGQHLTYIGHTHHEKYSDFSNFRNMGFFIPVLVRKKYRTSVT